MLNTPSIAAAPFKTLPFDGSDYDQWANKFTAFLSLMGIKEYIKEPKDKDGGVISDDMKSKNEKAYNHLLLAMNEPDSLEMVLNATSKRFLDDEDEECGDAPLAWKLLKDKWDPTKDINKHKLLFEFYHSKMEDVNKDPRDFILEMSIMQKKLRNMGENINFDSAATTKV
jgi:hypothetical protein